MAAGLWGTIIILQLGLRGCWLLIHGEPDANTQQRKTLKGLLNIEQDWLAYFGIKEWNNA